MYKTIYEDRVCFVFDSIQEAHEWLTALRKEPFCFELQGEKYELKNLKDVSVTFLATANVRKLGGVKNESVHSKQRQQNLD